MKPPGIGSESESGQLEATEPADSTTTSGGSTSAGAVVSRPRQETAVDETVRLQRKTLIGQRFGEISEPAAQRAFGQRPVDDIALRVTAAKTVRYVACTA